MSILTNNNKIFTLGGSVLNYTSPSLPIKGDLINMDLDGNGNKTYRVLSINGNVAKLLGGLVYDDEVFGGTENFAFANGHEGVRYAGSNLDIVLNTTWYNTLTDTVKTAIVPEIRTQYKYKETFESSDCTY